jgi:alkanesulfonate monooxygenase SsuD/methylene tetrahydromethanopterin reductase-like flavin-dependent oxidoreductase (luciferase family)
VVTLAAIFPPTQAPERLGPVAAAAEAAGLAQLWVWEDCFYESGVATATAILAATSRVSVGIGLLPVPLRNVALTAMEIATMARLFPGRLTAGIGHGVLDWMSQVGARVESPMTLLREYTAVLYALLRGETVTTHGRYVQLDQVALDWPPTVVPSLLVGGIRPRTVALAGELADGLIIPGGISPDDVRTSVSQFQAGRTAAGGVAGPAAGRPARGAADGPADIVVFVSVPADGPAADAAATIGEYARAGATHIAVNAAESDADLARFVGFLAREVAPLVEGAPGPRLASGQAEQQFVYDVGGEIAIQVAVGGLFLGQDGPGQRKPGHLDVDVGAQLTGGDAPADD